MSLLKNSFCRSQRKNQILTHQERQHTTQEAKTKKSFHIPFFNNTSKTAPAKDSTLQASSQKKSSINMRRQNIVHRTDCRRNTIWSDTVEGELVANLSPRELNRQEVLFEIIKTESE
ncbi:10353_t:CDS:1 [Funneliformis caledonium]|nr:10353_t:CDS:1 [Funneliformis caledonium]